MGNHQSIRSKRSYKSDAKRNPAWLTALLSSLPYPYQFPSFIALSGQAKRNGFAGDREGVTAFILSAVSRDVRRNALAHYGASHPQASSDYQWKPDRAA